MTYAVVHFEIECDDVERARDGKTAVDLTNCDREPIHVPGAIQPHGVLLACRGEAFTIS